MRSSTALCSEVKCTRSRKRDPISWNILFNNFPSFSVSGVVERQNIQGRNHFLSAGTNDQDSHQFWGPVEPPPLITVGSFLCASQEDWIAMTFLWAHPGHYQRLGRINGCLLASQIKKQAAWEMAVLRCVSLPMNQYCKGTEKCANRCK